MYRPRSRSPPPDRGRAYSPSRPLPPMRSPSPSASGGRRRYSPGPPPPRRGREYDDDYDYRRSTHPLPSRVYNDGYGSTPDRMYGGAGGYQRYDRREDPYRRSPSPPRRSYTREPPPARHYRLEEAPNRSGIMAGNYDYDDRYRDPSRAQDNQGKWERGFEVPEAGQIDEAEPSANGPVRTRGAKQPSAPSRDVIFLGLDPELSETDFAGYLKTEHRAQLESVKIVFDKITGHSKCFGFAAFSSIADAQDFVGINFPAVLMPALYAHSDPRKVKIDFSATLTGSNAADSGSSANATARFPQPGDDGMRDIGPPGGGNRVLLLRGLSHHSTPGEISFRVGEEIARLVGRPGQGDEAQRAVVRLVSIVDRAARNSWGYCFVEFATVELATAMLAFLIAPESQPQGFQISEHAIAASFANPAAFIPTPAGPLGSELVVRAARKGGIGFTTIDQPDGTWVGYWHPDAIPSPFVPAGAPAISDTGHTESLAPEIRSLLGSLSGEVSGGLSTDAAQQHRVTMPTGPISITMTGLQPIKSSKTNKVPDEGFVGGLSKNLLGDDEESDLVGKDSVLLSRTKGVSNIIGPSTRKVAKDISKWNTKKTELSTPIDEGTSAIPRGLSEANAALGVPRAGPSTAAATVSKAAQVFDYSDMTTGGKMACLLCQRLFKSEEELGKHTTRSELHKTNLLDSSVCEAGQQRKLAAQAARTSDGKYRDRAAERREVHHQPDKPVYEEGTSQPKRKFAEGPKPPPPPPVAAIEPGKDESNRGNQLLAKMGWKSGVGLGTSGEGRVDPILVQQFESRAGLGASKGHDASKWQGPGGFQARAKDMTKERFDQMSQQRGAAPK
ncbi:hypothetical protein BD324DRAFT_628787 [Kockovaella imperatae]|uniref:G-patch domain-containing protein n=1 Tax=Kockovaella imperatae TaxID=4999 RepID=A0A1Y1UEK3_9TREE|nr:hypothetical protein BD324DRAFT_628787 [Kockovaella imperatae]ORX36419.1 hypothetical protein BD324DRAFT_628787 [Kockovaella imperatae]